MNYQMSFIVTGDSKEGYLGELPKHMPEKCAEILEKLGSSKFTKKETVRLEKALHPELGYFALGVYEKAVIIADSELIPASINDDSSKFMQRALSLYPQGKLLMIMLSPESSVVAYKYYENGKQLRKVLGDKERVPTEVGDQLKEEQKVFQNSYIKDNMRHMHQVEGNSNPFYGETLVSNLMMKFFKHPIYDAPAVEDPLLKLEVDVFKKKKNFWQLIGFKN